MERERFFTMRTLYPEDIEEAYSLEINGYPADESASYEKLVYRQREAGEYFYGCFEGTNLVGYVCSTRSDAAHYTEEAMKCHVPNGGIVCIHSICVRDEYRRQGIGLKLLKSYIEYVRRMAFDREINKMALICKANLIPLYTKAGFTFIGPSSVVLGQNRWYEMELIFKRSTYDNFVTTKNERNVKNNESNPLDDYWK